MFIINIILKIFIIISSFFCSIKKEKKTRYLILQCLYCTIVLLVPVFIISYFIYIVAIIGNGSPNISELTLYLEILVLGCFYYYIFSNRKFEINLANSFLITILYLTEYIEDKSKIKLVKKYIWRELINFFSLFAFISFFVVGIILKTKITLEILDKISIIGIVFAFVITSLLYISVKKEQKERVKRKICAILFFTIAWIIFLVYLFFNERNFDNFLLLIFSMIFTFPTIYIWIKDIPHIITAPYNQKVEQRKVIVLEKYSIQNVKKIGNKYLRETIDKLGELWKKIKNIKTKNVLIILPILILFFIYIYYSQELIYFFSEKIRNYYISFNTRTNGMLRKILLLIILPLSFILCTIKLAITNEQKEKENLKMCISLIFLIEILIWVHP